MNDCQNLKKLLEEYGLTNKKHYVEEQITVENFNYSDLENIVNSLGTILDKNGKENQIIFYCYAGFMNMNTAIVAISLKKNQLSISAFSKEGLIKQNTCETVISRIKNLIND